MKICTKCGEEKAPGEFHKDAVRKDGLRGTCKACVSITSVAYSNRNKEALSVKNAKYRAENREELAKKRLALDRTPAGKARKARENKKYQATEGGKAVRNKAVARWTEKNPEEVKARQMVQSAVRAKRMPPASFFFCNTDCGEMALDYHHFMGTDEKNWYDVVPLCRKCHKAEHRRLDTTSRGG